jgi:rubrerythrin
MNEKDMETLLSAQQGEMDGVETYLTLAKIVHNETDVKVFKKLAADEGRHASVFKQYTGKALKPKKGQALAAAAGYLLLGKKIAYPIIAKFEYSAISGYEKLMKDYPEVESVKNDEKRHGDTINGLLKNEEFKDKPLLPLILAFIAVIALIRVFKKF